MAIFTSVIKSMVYCKNSKKKAKLPRQNTDENISNKPRKWSQFLAMSPLYILNLCYGMISGFPAILTPQLKDINCAGFTIDTYQESWIGKFLIQT